MFAISGPNPLVLRGRVVILYRIYIEKYMEHELIDSFWDLFVYDATAAISDAAHTKITETGFVQEFEQYTPKIYTEKPKEENADSVFHFSLTPGVSLRSPR
jgi:hypothetical protein